ncbi:MOSC domain-containing protein [Povalibacter sp.]|uniref:MOSC domain-containing protein n=1 Tax=Povalibacter sp. TaxID=1962978 RepID=UPI002F3E5AB3
MTLTELLATLPQVGTVRWIGVRPARRVAPIVVDSVEARTGMGLTGDRFSGRPESKRQVTLIQAEHLDVIGRLLHRDAIDPALLRRNIVVSGINLLALNGAVFQVGNAVFEGTGGCHPCSRMEEALGAGGYNAMRGHGGLTARVLESGVIRIGDEVRMVRGGQLARHES